MPRALREQARLDVGRLRLVARRDVLSGLAGAYQSAFRGRGLAFEELRDYAPGDEVRWMEWKATARLARPIVKRMREERDLVVCLLVDVSASLSFGSRGATKRASAVRAAAALAHAAIAARDRVAVATFARELIHRVDPGAGPVHLERVFRALAEAPEGAGTDATAAITWAARTLPRHSLVFLVSDLLFADPGPSLRRCARKHDLIFLRIRDPADSLPERSAPLRVFPIEGGSPRTLRVRGQLSPSSQPGSLGDAELRRLGVDVATLGTGAALLADLRRFLESRGGSRP
jgi:uncharacterized protein (DUF58 family)